MTTRTTSSFFSSIPARLATVAAAVCCLAAGQAQARTTLAYQGYVQGSESVSYVSYEPAHADTYNAGESQFLMKTDGVSSIFEAYCVDIFQYRSASANVYTLVDGVTYFGAEKADDIGRLMTLFDVWNGSTAITAQETGALQMAIWEIVQETATVDGQFQFDLATGIFTQTSAGVGTAALAQSWLDNFGGVESRYEVSAYTNASYQDYLVLNDAAITNAVPEPGSLALVLGAIGALGGAARRRKSTAA
jgi:hypothetical protein